MNLLFPESIANRPNGTQLIYLLFITLICVSVVGLFLQGSLMLIGSNIENINWSNVSYNEVFFYKIILSLSNGLPFALSAWIYSMAQTGNIHFLQFKKTIAPIWVIMTIVTTIGSLPMLIEVMILNQKMWLPEFLAPIEQWMRMVENHGAEITAGIMRMYSLFDLAVNLILIAVIPAVGEEMLFRGCLQPTLQRYTGNAHIGVWLAAIIFSAIHLQFYGFVPRMLLGALFGYFYLWSGNLWYPIIGHFVNNGLMVLLVYSGVVAANDLDATEQHVPLIAVALSDLRGLL